MRPAALLALFVLLALTLTAGEAFTVTCWNYTSGVNTTCNYPNGWTRVKYLNAGSYNLNVSYYFADVYPNDTVFDSYTLANARGAGSWNCTDSYTFTPNLYGAYSKCSPLYVPSTMCILESRIYYSNMGNNNQPYGYYQRQTSTGYSVTNHKTNTFRPPNTAGVSYTYMALYNGTCDEWAVASGGSSNWTAWSSGYGWNGDAMMIMLEGQEAYPDMVINMPVNGGVYNVSFTFQTNEVDIDGCLAPKILYRRFYNSLNVELGRNDTNLTGAGTQYWNINSTQWGTGFYVIATLECQGIVKVQNTNFFSLSILEPTPSIANGTTIIDPYKSVCFWTPYPNATCPSNNQTVLFYANGTLFWNVSNTDEVYFCFRDWNLHGVQNIEIKSYCASGGALNWNRIFVYDFRTWAEDRATDFSNFLITFDPSVRNFLLNIGIGLAVLTFLLFGAFAVKSMTKAL